MVLMYTAARLPIRKANYELFWYLHHLYFVFYVLLFMHPLGCFVKSADTGLCKGTLISSQIKTVLIHSPGYNTLYFAITGFVVYLLERILRFYRSHQPTNLTKVVLHPGNTIELQFEKPSMSYIPGQYLYINDVKNAYWQWHPFTISSAPEDGFISLHIRIAGDWTKRLYDHFEMYANQDVKALKNSNLPRLYIDGPFGAPAQDLFDYEVAAFLAAGIGVTPAAGILKSLLFKYQRGAPMKLRKLYFVWVTREVDVHHFYLSSDH